MFRGIVLVARRIGDNEAPPRRSEVAVCHVDGDALFPFRLKAVEQECGIESSPTVPCSLESRFRARFWSSSTSDASSRSRPISVDLPSSTDPQVRKRSCVAYVAD